MKDHALSTPPPPVPLNWRKWLGAWGPVLVFMALIFFFSAQPKHAPDGNTTRFYFSGVMPVFVEHTWEALIKKSAHVAGYAMLTALSMRALHREGRTAREAAYFALLLALSYALTDELHQAFVPGRNASVLDIGFDYVGAACATLIGRRILTRRAGHKHQN